MLDHHKMRELEATVPVLELEESSYKTYEKLTILKALRFFQELEEAGGLQRFLGMADAVSSGARATDYPAAGAGEVVDEAGDSEFLQAVAGKDQRSAWAVMDELMGTLRVLNGRAYNNVLRKIRAL